MGDRASEGVWSEFRARIKKHWTKLTDDDLDFMSQGRRQFLERLQERYGLARPLAEQELAGFLLEVYSSKTPPSGSSH